jgi:hypothetical protein
MSAHDSPIARHTEDRRITGVDRDPRVIVIHLDPRDRDPRDRDPRDRDPRVIVIHG